MKRKTLLLASMCVIACIALALCAACGGKPESNTAKENQPTGLFQVKDPAASNQGTQAAAGKGISPERTKEERMATSASDNETKPGRHVVYLTFDDGPSTNTHRILDILAKYGVHATWFVKGNQEQVAYVKDIWEAGHQLAIHTYTHDYQQVYASEAAYWDDLQKAGDVIKEHVGFSPTLVRFPGGSTCSYSIPIADNLIDGMKARQLHYFDWNVSSGDGADHTASELAGYVKDGADGCNSACVLMHDSAAKDTTVEALPEIIEYFIAEGYEFDVLMHDSFGYHF